MPKSTWTGDGTSEMADADDLERLLTATAEQDRAAFAQLYRLTSPRLFAIALKMMRRRDLAEDILQDAYLAIWRKASRYDPKKGAALPWMTTVVRHRALDYLRSAKAAAADALGDERAQSSGVGEGGMPMFDGVAGHTLAECLARLSAAQREAIVLAYCYGFTHEELAARLSCPVGTVKSWVRRGLLQLKECFEA